jgi:ubiquinone/menaquinone biosynthesis C-methylase UbiE
MVSLVDYDAELQLHNRVLRRAYGIRHGDRILDVGCGAGETTRDAARMAADGSALGIDVSAEMIERARALSEAEGLRNISFEVGDAQFHSFPSGHFDVVISRFGTMFFADPVAAFAGLARALRPEARLVMMVWQAHDSNDWSVAIQRALTGSEAAPRNRPGVPDPFSLSDQVTVERILGEAGFDRVTFADVHVPIYYGPDVDAALKFVGRFACTNDALAELDPAAKERALERLREALAAHHGPRGVWFDSRAWIVTARTAPYASARDSG